MGAVYGVVVPNTDGKAGMASLLLKPGAVADAASLASLFEFVGRELPPYAQPMFLRIRTREVGGDHEQSPISARVHADLLAVPGVGMSLPL